MNLQSDTILITGGTSGIGLEMAKQLIALGNTVIITGRNLSKLEETKKALPSVHIYQSDVSDENAICDLYAKVVSDFPNLNVLINNAGIMRAIDFNDTNCGNVCEEIDIHSYTKSLRSHLKNTSVEVFELAPPKTSKPLFDRSSSSTDKKNPMPAMDIPDAVKAMIHSMKKNRFEILPGMSKLLKLAGRFSL